MSPPDNDLKWFGEGFDRFPRSLPENCVEYTIYIIDSSLQDYETREQLRWLHVTANALTKKLLKGFLWQKEPFGLELVCEDGRVIVANVHMVVSADSQVSRNEPSAGKNELRRFCRR